jgi:MYXO-CTERM domain-containing protein
MNRILTFALGLAVLGVSPSNARAAVRLIGITGNQETNAANDETLYEINITNAATTRLFQTSHIPDSDTIGYNPVDGLLYHMSGSSSYRDTPGSNGYRDNQYMEKINVDTQAMTGVFNANPPPSPDTALAFGLPAPRPTWVLPAEIRTDEQTDPSFGDEKGVDEYGSAREMAWSATEQLFYISTGDGLFSMTPAGVSKFIGAPTMEPGDMKGLEFVTVGGQPRLVFGSKETGVLYQIDPATGLEIGDGVLVTVGGTPTMRILGLATHPDTGVLYGITEPIGADPISGRELVTINPSTGEGTLIGILANAADPFNADAAFSSLAFVGFKTLSGDFDADGDVDGNDFLRWQRGEGVTMDAANLALWKANYGAGASIGAAGAVPEPAAAALALLGLGHLAARRRRRAA